jgi:osmoprotectant transport system substrate-binding protein
LLVLATTLLAGCATGDRARPPSSALGDDAITIGSFNFAESQLLAQLYGQALEARGVRVLYETGRGPRELVLPALERGLLELVPEYAGTAVQFLSLGRAPTSADKEETHKALQDLLTGRQLVALAPADAEDKNVFVVKYETAGRYDLGTVSDLAAVADKLRFVASPECPHRPLCLIGLRDRYHVNFGKVLALDSGGPLTRRALEAGFADVGLLFSTDPGINDDAFLELVDDRQLQPAENVTPLVRREVLERWGEQLSGPLDAVSRQLTTLELQSLNGEVASGATDAAGAAAAWLARRGLR